MKTIKTILSAAAVLLALPLLTFAKNKGIYGEDNRLDYYAAPREMQTLADSVVSLWKGRHIKSLASGKVQLKTAELGRVANFCADTRFKEQPIGANCSGSLVGPDLVLTAAHCAETEADCRDMKIAFGYAVKRAGGKAETILPAGEVYGCARIVKRLFEPEGADYALLQLDRKVTGHKPLRVSRGADLKKGDGVFVIGHPLGLPLKVAGGATVRDYSKPAFFKADLDTFAGNSGSPVFNAGTGKIEGILVRGDADLDERDFPAASAKPKRMTDEEFFASLDGSINCVTMAAYSQTGGDGESVTKVSLVAADIPLLPGEEAGAGAAKGKPVDVDPGRIRDWADSMLRKIRFDR
ncbi:MAG: serine protease [Elusimicrobia bacterium]|nr:serine protease [Elusimicrobiota bacterium]